MVARKSPRVKKSTVVYQAPEQAPRASRNVTPKPIPPRRSSNRDIELQMECIDDELSPAQLRAIKEAQKEHEKANDLIKEVRAGNILVPSSQPNTFTIVPPKPPPAPPKPPAQQVQASAIKSVSPLQDAGSQRGLPPPRPAQFLSKHLQEVNKTPGSRASPDVIFISDTPAISSTSKNASSVLPASQMTGNSLQIQQVTSLLASQGPGATPQQVYKFVSLPSNVPANMVQNQWALRPLLTVPPQQQPQMTFLSPAQGVTHITAQGAAVTMKKGQMPAPRFTGEELNIIGGAKLANGRGERHAVIHETYLKKYGMGWMQNRNCLLSANYQHLHKIKLKNVEEVHCVSSRVYSWKVGLHFVRTSKLFNVNKAAQAYNKSQAEFGLLASTYKCWLKSTRWKVKSKFHKLKKSPAVKLKNNVLKFGTDSSKDANDLISVCDNVELSYKEPSRNVDVLSDLVKEEENPSGEENAHSACDSFDSMYQGGQNFNNDTGHTLDMCLLLNDKTGHFSDKVLEKQEKQLQYDKQIECSNSDHSSVHFDDKNREEIEVEGQSGRESKAGNLGPSGVLHYQGRSCKFQSEFVSHLECTRFPEVVQESVSESSVLKYRDNAYQKNFLEFLAVHRTSPNSDVRKVRSPIEEVNHINKNCGVVVSWKKVVIKIDSCLKENKINILDQSATKECYECGRINGKDGESIKCFTRSKCDCFERDKIQWKKEQLSFSRLYEALFENYIPRQFGIVNMLHESARYMSCDSENSSMRTADECASIAENRLSDITNISSGDDKENVSVEIQDSSLNSVSQETTENDTAESQPQEFDNKFVEHDVSKGKIHIENMYMDNSTSEDEMNTVEPKENQKEQLKVAETFGNVNEKSPSDSTADVDTDKSKADLSEREKTTSRTGDILVFGENKVADEQDGGRSENEDFWSDCSGEVSSEDEIEIPKQEDRLYVKPKALKNKWYEEMPTSDAVYVVLLCSHYGFTKISRDLQIPKTELLKLRRSVRKSKCYQIKVFETSSESRVSDGPKYNLVKSATCKQEDLWSSDVSVLKTVHPFLFKTAQTLIKDLNKTSESDCEVECQQDYLEKKTKSIASEQIEPRQRPASVVAEGSSEIDLSYLHSGNLDCFVEGDSSNSGSASIEEDNLTPISGVGSLIKVSENSEIPNTQRLIPAQQDCSMVQNNYEVESRTVGIENLEGRSDQQKYASNEFETKQTEKLTGKIDLNKTDAVESSEYFCKRFENFDSGDSLSSDADDLVIDFDARSFNPEDDVHGSENKFKDNSGSQRKSCDMYSKEEKKCILDLEETLLSKSEERIEKGIQPCFSDSHSSGLEKLKNFTGSKHKKPLAEIALKHTDDKERNYDSMVHNREHNLRLNGDVDGHLVKVSGDHCYEKILNVPVGRKEKDNTPMDEVAAEYENSCLLEEHDVLYKPLSDCLTYPKRTFEKIDGREVSVFEPISEEKLNGIISHVSSFGLKSATECYNMPEEHIQIFIYHALSCSKQNESNSCQKLELGIPSNYVSSNSVEEIPPNKCVEMVSVYESSDNNDRHTQVESVITSHDILNTFRVDNEGKPLKPDTVKTVKAKTQTGIKGDFTKCSSKTPVLLTDGEKLIIFVDKSGIDVPKDGSKYSNNTISKKVQKGQDVNKTANTQGCNTGHPVYTRDFLQYFSENDLYQKFRKADEEEITEEHQKVIKSIDLNYLHNVKTYRTQTGKERHRYSPGLQREVLLLATKVGFKVVSCYFDIKIETLLRWKQNLRKALEDFEKADVDKTENARKDQVRKHHAPKQKKRVLLSKTLRIKIVHLCKSLGISEVCKQYSLNRKTVRKWMRNLKDEKLPNYELTNEELVQLVDNLIYKSTSSNVDTLKSTCSGSLGSAESHEESCSSLRIESVVGSNHEESGECTEITKNEEEVEQDMWNECAGTGSRNIKGSSSEKLDKQNGSDKSLQMTYPNNMEVILGVDDDDDDVDEEEDDDDIVDDDGSENGSIMRDLEVTNADRVERRSVICDSDLDADSELDENIENVVACPNDNTKVAGFLETSKENSLKEDFIEQNSSFIEAINKELLSEESENDDVIEIVSWNVNTEHASSNNRTINNLFKGKLDQSDHYAKPDKEVIVVDQNQDGNNEKSKNEAEVRVKVIKDDKKDTEIPVSGNKKVASLVSEESITAQIQINPSEGQHAHQIKDSTKLECMGTGSEEIETDLGKKATRGDQNSLLEKVVICSDERNEQVKETTVIPIEGSNLSPETFVDNDVTENEMQSNDGCNLVSGAPANSQAVDVELTDETGKLDGKNSSLEEPQLQILNSVDIKDEPYDEEFERVEKGMNLRSQDSDQNDKGLDAERLEKERHRRSIFLTGVESNAITSDKTNSNSSKKTGSKEYEINQLGTGDGSNSQSQGSTFQSNSGTSSSGAQGTPAANMTGNISNIDLNISSLSAGSANVQIVGTQDLIPGQEYILVDPRLFTSGSNTFQNIRPPALLRPPVRGSVNAGHTVSPRLHVRGLVSSVPNSSEPTPVHIVENKSIKIGASLQGSAPQPNLTVIGHQDPSSLGQSKHVHPGNPTVRSLLTGIQKAPSSNLSGTVILNARPSIHVQDKRNLSPGRISQNTSPNNSSRVVIHKSKSPLDHSKIISKGEIVQICNETSQSVSSNILKSVEHISAHTAGPGKDKPLSVTLKGVGSISNENVAILGTSGLNKPGTSTEYVDKQEQSVHESSRPREEFTKYVSNSELLLEKERKILQALLLQKSGHKKTLSPVECSSKPLPKPADKHCQMASSNRIDSLIQKMTNRVCKGSDDYKMSLNLSVIGTDKSKKIETEKDTKPCSASEILFGEHSSPKKTDTRSVGNESITKQCVPFNSGMVRSASPGNSSSLTKKDLRKSPLVTREIDSTEDESSSSSSTSEGSSTSTADSSVEMEKQADGRIEHVDLSAKLKSLLSADIFNVIESEKQDKEEDDDLIEMLANPSEDIHNSNTDSSPGVSSTATRSTDLKRSPPVKKGSYINYSLNIKKKLGKLASMFSIVSLNKKYGIGTQTLSKWKAKFQDEEVAGLELTEEELKELEEVNKVKKALYGSSEPEYDIYVDNPEEDVQDNEQKKKISREENLPKNEIMRKTGTQVEKKQPGVGISKTSSIDTSSLTSKLSKPNSDKTSKKTVKSGTPLYITLDDDASDEVKQQLRRNLKTQKTAEQAWSNGAFLDSSQKSIASVFGIGGNELEEKIQNAPLVGKSQNVSVTASDTESASERENDDASIKNHLEQKTQHKSLEGKPSDSDIMTWEKTVYLCPDEGVFKYRYEMKSNQESTKNNASENQTLSVLDSLFKSPLNTETATDTVLQDSVIDQISEKQLNTSSPATIAKMLKETVRQGSLTRLTTDRVKSSTVPVPTCKDKPLGKELKQNAANNEFSDDFKWTVVKEARKSGFEKTASWYDISMTDIMKWHDTFLHEKRSKETNLPKVQSLNTTEASSALVDLTLDEDLNSRQTVASLTPTPIKGRLGSLNANLSFERIQVKEGAITKPRFNSKPNAHPVVSPIPAAAISPSSRPQRTRMGPNTIKYATPRVDPDQLQKFQADVQGDLGIMPKLMKKTNSKDGVEIASTWKQVQSVLRPEKLSEKRYSQEFKHKIISECEQKGQKTVAREHRIPYNEISRWRLEAKKGSAAAPQPSSAFAKIDSSKKSSSTATTETVSMVSTKKSHSEPNSSKLALNETRPGGEQESLKIKIKLSSLSLATPAGSKRKAVEPTAELEASSSRDRIKPTGQQKTLTKQIGEKTSHMKTPMSSRGNKNVSDKGEKKDSVESERTKSAVTSEHMSIDEDADLRMEVINFCFDQGVLKTQKKYNVTRQSIIDLMKEYDELNKYEVDNYNKSHGFPTFKTKLVSREKTSVEVTSTATQPVIVKNLNDYIVTHEYMKTVVDYALRHGITAASRKYKRKTNTVRSWMNQFQREVKKKISVEQLAKEQELIANNMSLEDARKISNLEARKKKQLLEAEFKRHIVEFARQFGITAASRRFKKKAATVKSWMGHFMKSERDAKRQEEAETRKKQSVEQESMKSSKQIPVSSSPEKLSLRPDSFSQPSLSSNKQRSPSQSLIWEQDFVIKPSSSKSPLKLTFSPRRKSSPVIMIGSSTEEDTVDDETNDIETDDEQENNPVEYFEVAAWNLDSSDNKSAGTGNSFKKVGQSVINLDEDKQSVVDNIVDLSDEDIFRGNAQDCTNLNQHQIATTSSTDNTVYSKSQKVESDHLKRDVLISPMDVPNILDIENIPMVVRENVEENDMTEGNKTHDTYTKTCQEVEEILIIDQTEDEDEIANGSTPQLEERMKIPYEETVMFKLLTEELDNFMKDDSAVAKYNVGKEKNRCNVEVQAAVLNENKDSKPGPMKKFKKYADAEIIQNIEDTYLFTGSRVTRNAAGKEVQTNDEAVSKENIASDDKTETEIDDKQKCSSEENNQVQHYSEEIKADNTGGDLQKAKLEKDSSDKEKQLSAKDMLPDKPADGDSQKKGERSLFDILVSENETTESSREENKERFPSPNVTNEMKEEVKSPFSLFGNLMKSFKVSQPFGVKSPTDLEKGADFSEPTTSDTVAGVDSPGKSDELNKDKSERNLFDFICPEPETPRTPTTPTEVSTSDAQSPRMQTRSIFRTGGSPVLSPQKASGLKVTPVKKPMFKFPKLALPVNFGNIAKLGMARMKEEEMAKESKDSKIEESEIQGSVTCEENATAKETNNENKSKEIVRDENETETKSEIKSDIVMETFEELRQRLARERAANKLEKEKSKLSKSETESLDADEIDGSREVSTNITAIESTEIDSEMYKDFTPQKIILILDISKKHGVEFASTSFGLPVSVIVNWIIEKDRKQRKAALSVSLEEKLKALKCMKDGKMARDDVKEKHGIDNTVLQKWDSEFGWMIENRNVCDVLNKWQTVETVTNINFEECVKNLERRDSVVDKEQNEEKMKNLEMSERTDAAETSERNDDAVPEKNEMSSTENITENNDVGDVIVTSVESDSDKGIEALAAANDLCESNTENSESSVPEIISFVKTTKPRDFSLQQKAMFVLLCEKYGSHMLGRKFGINSGTLHYWRYSNRPVRQYLNEQTHGYKVYSDQSKSGDNVTEKVIPGPQSQTFNVADYMPVRETRSSSDKKNIESRNETAKTEEMLKSFKETKPILPHKAKPKERDPRLEDDLIDHPKGYRIISPTKLPPVLRDARRCQTKDYTLEQRVAIVKLVQLYGVRTIHKQFRIPAGSIWNWQHARNVNDVLKKEKESEKESQVAQRELDFDEENEEDDDEPVTIDTILDRVLIASDTVNHLNFKIDQKADVVCLINYFGIDYFCEKVPQIPRGTLWNWRHNRHVAALVEKRNEMIKRFSDILSKRKGKSMRENVVGETVDKTDLTQKWLKDLQDNVHDKRKVLNQRESSVESIKRKRGVQSEIENVAKKKPKLGPMCYKRSQTNDRNRRSLSPSTICSEISVHSDDFEEILSEDEVNTPSVISKRSGTSTQTVQSNKTSRSQQRTSKGSMSGKIEKGQVLQSGEQDSDKTDKSPVPVHEIVKFESGKDDRLMVCYTVLEGSEVASKHVKIDTQNQAMKRPSPNELATSQPPAKKKNSKLTEIADQSGNWVPLDEYYYGTHEGDVSYTEEKGEYRFKCWYCSKMLYNNVRAMQHIQGHIDASKQQNIDLSDLTQCKHCYKQFDTPFEMQTHVEKVHLSNKVLMCRICEKDFSTSRELTVHMKGNHHACEMPYVCHLCDFRSSMYSDVVDHFKKKHDSSHYMLCLYCLRTFEVKFVSQGWGQTQTYYGHLLKHQTKSATKKCVVCRLTFFNAIDVKNHRKNCHTGNYKDVKALTYGGKADTGLKQKTGSNLKSLNAPSVSRIQDYGEIIFPAEASNTKCVECKMMMSSTDHYKKYVHCSMCRFATSCSVAYANHMMGFHSGQMSSLNLNIPWERPMKEVMYCACGFNSKYGNKIANHLVYCAKRTCYSTRRSRADTTIGKAGDDKKEGSILGMLGLVQKSTVATKIRSKPKLETKSGMKESEKLKKTEIKADIKDLDEVKQEDELIILDETKSKETACNENKGKTVKETTKHSNKEDAEPVDSKVSFDEKSKRTLEESDKVVEEHEREKPAEETDKNETDREADISETCKSTDEKELMDTEVANKMSEDLHPDMDTQTVEDKSTRELTKVDESTDGKELMDTEVANKRSEDLHSDMDTLTEQDKSTPELTKVDESTDEKELMDTEVANKTSDDLHPDMDTLTEEDKSTLELTKDEKEEIDTHTVNDPETAADIEPDTQQSEEKLDDSNLEKYEEETKDTKETDTKESLEAGNSEYDSQDIEELEPLNKTEDKEMVNEMDTFQEAVESPKSDLDTEDLISKTDTKQSELVESDIENKPDEEDENEDSAEKEKDVLELTTENTESTEAAIKTDEKTGEDEVIEEEETGDKEQDFEESTADKDETKTKKDKEPKENKEPEEHEKLQETERSGQKESSDHNKSRRSEEKTSSGDHRSRESHYSGDRRDSSERHSREKYDSGDRHHSGSSDRSRSDDRSRQGDRHHQENRSYGSNRSDSYHGNRSYDQNRDRDRSYNRDRDRDYNRNRDYRHGDSRSEHGYQDNRGQGYGGGGQGYRGSQSQYGGYQGNRGDNYQDRNRGGNQQDRNYNRNYQNRGGYNQNYRGGYRGGYY